MGTPDYETVYSITAPVYAETRRIVFRKTPEGGNILKDGSSFATDPLYTYFLITIAYRV